MNLWILFYFLLHKLVLPSPQGTSFQFSKYILSVFSVQIIFPPSGMWECEGEDEEQTHLFKHLLKAFIQPSLQIFILVNY